MRAVQFDMVDPAFPASLVDVAEPDLPTAAWARVAVRTLERVDEVLLKLAPPLRNWCGEAVIVARRK